MIGVLALLAYLFTWYVIYQRLQQRLHEKPMLSHIWVKAGWGLALLLHAMMLHFPVVGEGGLVLGFYSASAHVFWWLSFLLLITTIYRALETLALFVFPLIIISILLALSFDSAVTDNIQLTGGLGIHIFTSLLAYSMLLLATLQALLVSWQSRNLHQHHTNGFMRTLPAMQDMEHLLFQLITFGVVLLTFALASGFFFLEDIWGQQVAHKTILSILAWFVFSSLLLGHWVYGWRGKIAVRWILAGFVLLMLAYFGSKFVIEFLIA
jgi:ABC-type uncharacterized transport system permease subunit